MSLRVLVVGDGGWGTALALVLHGKPHSVGLWSYLPQYAAEVRRTRKNERYLPGVELPVEIDVDSDFARLAAGAELVVSAVPTQFMRRVFEESRALVPPEVPIVSCSKGIEFDSLALPSAILSEVLETDRVVVLSGPSHAEEVSQELPTSVVVAAPQRALALKVQDAFTGPRFRVYTNPDTLGVELAGALKNVIALAAGISDGLGYGDNSRAALITRGAAEITRLGVAMGARPETFAGLAGIGDLIATATSKNSRNWTVGHRVGRGEKIDAILAGMQQVAEGVPTTQAARALADRLDVELPITDQVHGVLFEGKEPRDAVEALMGRRSRSELE